MFLILQVIEGKAERKVIIALLRFKYLTLPICAGIELKTPSKEGKQREKFKSQLAMASRRRASGEHKSESTRNHSQSTRNGE